MRYLRSLTSLPLVQLLEHELGDLADVASYADAIGIYKPLATAEGVRAAHAAGLKVHVWTFRAENEFLPDELRIGTDVTARGQLRAEIERYLALGIDGFFTDHPAIGVQTRDGWRRSVAGA